MGSALFHPRDESKYNVDDPLSCTECGATLKLEEAGVRSRLPREVLVECLSFLTIPDVVRFGECSRWAQQLSNDDYLWTILAKRRGIPLFTLESNFICDEGDDEKFFFEPLENDENHSSNTSPPRASSLVQSGARIQVQSALCFELLIGNNHCGLEGTRNIHIWEMFVKGDGNLRSRIERIEYDLHPTFRPQVVSCEKEPYLLRRRGWGYFEVNVRVVFKPWVMSDPIVVDHELSFERPSTATKYRIRIGSSGSTPTIDSIGTIHREDGEAYVVRGAINTSSPSRPGSLGRFPVDALRSVLHGRRVSRQINFANTGNDSDTPPHPDVDDLSDS